ncbi:heavy-metal-associated domain-containing protein [Leptothrix discophora]|uniref:Heavy-metal-associated domain-containing protein n=1 Tax=Leptothrix discophora TaxID=89 RepID=A0ABT9FYA2_LEPDI|nr:heavy-metal-associated domain-containing protein [Leptothrix discophora]MDP4299126.1 heavy-metal-associated domain-containing protein [Leptothrix discophora]
MIEFQLPTMTCGHCVKAVTAAIQSVDAQARVAIDLPTHQVKVETGAEKSALAEALKEAGYEPA